MYTYPYVSDPSMDRRKEGEGEGKPVGVMMSSQRCLDTDFGVEKLD